MPLVLPLTADLVALTAAVGGVAGWYVLVPVDRTGARVGDVLDAVVIGDAHESRTPTAATRLTLDDLGDEVADTVRDDDDDTIQTS
ncbi:MAG: hypothetical protein R3B06_07955 [Kofleriaceae bacterium]